MISYLNNYLYTTAAIQPLAVLNHMCCCEPAQFIPVQKATEILYNLEQFCLCDDYPQPNCCAEKYQDQGVAEEIKSMSEDLEGADEISNLDIEVLKECFYSLRYDNVGMTSRKRRVILCGYENCGKEFVKAWNFLDHFRMHQGVRPYVCEICDKSFTQKGNLK